MYYKIFQLKKEGMTHFSESWTKKECTNFFKKIPQFYYKCKWDYLFSISSQNKIIWWQKQDKM